MHNEDIPIEYWSDMDIYRERKEYINMIIVIIIIKIIRAKVAFHYHDISIQLAPYLGFTSIKASWTSTMHGWRNTRRKRTLNEVDTNRDNDNRDDDGDDGGDDNDDDCDDSDDDEEIWWWKL